MRTLNGSWKGYYVFDDPVVKDKVPVTVRFNQAGERFSGEWIEPGLRGHPKLVHCILNGQRWGSVLVFSKTRPDVSHGIVVYRGILEDSPRIVGVWNAIQLPEFITGTFELRSEDARESGHVIRPSAWLPSRRLFGVK